MNSLKSLFKSFGYAFRGIFYTLQYERNMRIHFVCMLYMYTFLGVYDFFAVTRTQFAVLFLANALVVAAELVNTAVERTVDLASSERTEKGKIAKDAAAGAVLVCAIFAVCVGIAVLGQKAAFLRMFAYYTDKPWMFAVFVLSIVPATLFIFKGFGKKSTQDNSTETRKDKPNL